MLKSHNVCSFVVGFLIHFHSSLALWDEDTSIHPIKLYDVACIGTNLFIYIYIYLFIYVYIRVCVIG